MRVTECEWDEVLIPTEWDDYLSDYATWESDTADWEADDPDTRGDAPIEPEEPTDDASRPSLVAERSWTYGGPGEAAFSDYFLMVQPEVNGQVRPVNMMITCYHYERVGVKPTAHGEVIVFDF